MKCPGCGFDSDEGSADCPACGLVFAKFQARRASSAEPPAVPSPPDPTAPPDPDAPPGSPSPPSADATWDAPDPAERMKIGLLLFAVVLVLGIAVYFLFGSKSAAPSRPNASPEAAGVPEGAEADSNRGPDAVLTAMALSEQAPPTPTPGVKVEWRFEGKVIDLLHLTPIEGVTISFAVDSNQFAVTGPDGTYQAAVSVDESAKGLYPSLSHPDYGTNHWEGDWSAAPYEKRIQMYGQVPFHGSIQGNPQETRKLDFAMFPQKLTEEEETKIRDTLYPPAKD
jgi:hypothetical protein